MPGGRRSGEPPRQALERARLARLVRASVVIVGASLLVDAVGGRMSDGPDASEASESRDTTPTIARPPVTLVPLASTPGVAPVISRIETTDPVVFMTIDDGHTRNPEVKAALEELGVPVSLFLVDGPVQADPEFFRRLPDTVVESHSRTHPDLRTLSEDGQRAEICGNADTLEAAFGRRPVLFRPPYGAYNEATTRAAAACGMAAIVLWEVSVNGADVGFRTMPQLRPGDILLMHFRSSFVTELRALADRVDEAGLRFARLEDYLVPESVAGSAG
ncbi:MAG: polysaccharide deacetylase family protein [Acidimicrobiales bacterium]